MEGNEVFINFQVTRLDYQVMYLKICDYFCSGPTLAAEVKILTEMFFDIALKYFLYSKTIYLQAGALYTLYGLYYKQPLQ